MNRFWIYIKHSQTYFQKQNVAIAYVKEVLSGYSKVKNIRFNTRGGIKNGCSLDETCWQSLLEQIIRE